MGCWVQVRPWGQKGVSAGQKGVSGVSGGEKGAVAAPSCREVNQEGKKNKREGKNPNKEV